METTILRRLYDEHHRRTLVLTGFRREEMPPVVRYVGQSVPRSFINHSTLTSSLIQQTIEREVLYFRSLGHTLEWKVYDYDQPPDLPDQLAAAGFEIGEDEALLVLDAAALLENTSPSDADIRQITDPIALSAAINRVQNTVFDNPPDGWMNETLTAQLRDAPDSITVYAVYDGEDPVSLAWITYSNPGNPFAGLYGGATLPDYRQRGYYTALVRARAADAQQRGVRYLHVDASPMSRPVLEKRGFIYLATTREAILSAS